MRLSGFRINCRHLRCALERPLAFHSPVLLRSPKGTGCTVSTRTPRQASVQSRLFGAFAFLCQLVFAFAFALALALASSLALPAQAYADYTNPSVNTVAQMRTDGSLHVVEQRSYAFEEDYSAVTWRFTGITDKQGVEVASVRIIQMDAEGNIVRDWDRLPEVAFQSNWRDFVRETGGQSDKVEVAERELARSSDSSDAIELPKGDSFAFDKRRCELYVFLESTEHSTVIECDYAISNAALVYDDTAEMYWDYVPAQSDVETTNVRTQVQLPVPEGVEVVPGKTILAWGHGPEGAVDVRADGTVHYFVPEVREGQYAQAHVLFPRSWLTNITVQSKLAKSGTRFDDAVAEEASWTDSYTWGVVNAAMLSLALHVLCVIALVGAVLAYAVWGRERRPDDATDACGGMLEGVDAAVLGRLLRWNQHSAYDFADTLCQLERRGVISIGAEVRPAIDEGLEAHVRSGDAQCRVSEIEAEAAFADVRFRITPSAKSARLSEVEQGAMELLFDTVGDGYQSVSVDEVRRFCKAHPSQARAAMGTWQGLLSDEVEAERLFDSRSRKVSRWLFGVGAVFAAFAMWEFLVPGNLSMAGALLATGAVVAAVGYCMPRRTPRGVMLAECVEARADGMQDADAPAWRKAVADAFGDALVA